MSSTETLPATPPSKKRKLEVAGDDEQVTRVTIVNLCRYDCNFSPWRFICRMMFYSFEPLHFEATAISNRLIKEVDHKYFG